MAVKKPGISSDNPNRRAGRYDAVGDNDVGHRYTETDNRNVARYVGGGEPPPELAGVTVNADTFQSIGITVGLAAADDTDHNSTVAVEYKKSSSGTWLDAQNLIRNDYQWFSTSNPTPTQDKINNFSGSIMFLTPGTSYDIRLTYSDPQGSDPQDTAVYQGTVSTRAISVKPTGGTDIYVDNSVGGGGNGSTGSPYNTLAAAVAVATAGDRIKLRTGSGSYPKTTLDANGAEGNYIVIEPDTANSPVVDALVIDADHIWIDNLAFVWNDQDSKLQTFVDGNVTPGTDRITLTGHGFSDFDRASLSTTGTLPAGLTVSTTVQPYDYPWVRVIDANTIELYDYQSQEDPPDVWGDATIIDITAAAGGGTHTISTAILEQADTENTGIYVLADTAVDDVVITNNTFNGYVSGIASIYFISRWVVMDNTLVGWRPAGTGQDDQGPAPWKSTGQGIAVGGEGAFGRITEFTNTFPRSPSSVVAYNSITRHTDGVGVYEDSDVYGNHVFDEAGNACSMDAAYGNVRVWGNLMQDSMGASLTWQPQRIGPWYWLYNQIGQNQRGVFKQRTMDRSVMINNTFFDDDGSLSGSSATFMKNFMRNNLFIASGSSAVWNDTGGDAPPSGNTPQFTADWNTDIDYDGFSPGGSNIFFWDSVNYSTMASWTAAVDNPTLSIYPESNGVKLTTAVFDDYSAVLTDSSYLLVLASGANDAVDAGILVDNLADWHGATPDLGAHQRGETALHYGPRAGAELIDKTEYWTKH